MASTDDLVATSKFLSYLLRHHPEGIGLELDENGWANIGELIQKAEKNGRSISRNEINQILGKGAKRRFILSEDGEYIRAGYGHSIDVDLELKPTAPPDELYHGTAKKNLSSIVAEGIHPGSRNFVHLSTTYDDAQLVGSRHGKHIILTVHAKQMSQEGFDFYQSENESCIWLTKKVPPAFLKVR